MFLICSRVLEGKSAKNTFFFFKSEGLRASEALRRLLQPAKPLRRTVWIMTARTSCSVAVDFLCCLLCVFLLKPKKSTSKKKKSMLFVA